MPLLTLLINRTSSQRHGVLPKRYVPCVPLMLAICHWNQFIGYNSFSTFLPLIEATHYARLEKYELIYSEIIYMWLLQ